MHKYLLLIVALCGASISFAGIGKAIVPITQTYYVSGTDYIGSAIYVTNLTNHSIRLYVTFYGKDGSIMPASFVNYYNLTNANTEIAANSTGNIYIQPTSASALNYGKAIIEWENLSGNDDTIALIAHAQIHRLSAAGDARSNVPINNGMPF